MQALRRTALIASVLTIACILFVDQPFARWLWTRDTHPIYWEIFIGYLEYLTGIVPYRWLGVWILCIGSIATLLVPRLRPYAHGILLVTLVHLLDRNITMWLKLGTGRLRPLEWIEHGGDHTFWFWRDGWSFPSGHIALFASLCIPIAVAYPRARPVVAIVVAAGCARILAHAHFIGDVLGGIALACALTWLCAIWLRRALPSQIRPAYLQ